MMKKLFYFAAIATVAFSCTKVELEEPNISLDLTEREVTLTVNTSEGGSAASRVSYNTDDLTCNINVFWAEEDALNVVMGDYSNSKFEMVEGSMNDESTSAQFSGSVLGDDYRLIYPYDENIEIDSYDGYWALSIEKQVIDMSDNGLSSMAKYNYMVSPWLDANDDNSTVTMQHVTAALKIGMRFTNLPEDVDFTLNDIYIGRVYSNFGLDTSLDITSDNFYCDSNTNGVYAFITNSPAVVNYSADDEESEYYMFATIIPYPRDYIPIEVTLKGSDGNLYTKEFEFNSAVEIDLARATFTSINYMCDMTDATISQALFDGRGIAEDPFLINTADDFWAFSSAQNSGEYSFRGCYFQLTDDIDLGCDQDNQWIPIGEGADVEELVFDGAGHTISGIYINNEKDSQGLFASIENSTIANLTVEGVVSSTGTNCGGIVGYPKYSNIYNSHNRVNVTSTSRVGGIAGGGQSNTFVNCSNTGDITGDDDYYYYGGRVGGITGTSANGRVIGCYNSGEVTNSSGEAHAIAGPGGDSRAILQNCYYADNIEADDIYATSIASGDMMGQDFVDKLNIDPVFINKFIKPEVSINEWVVVDSGYPTTSLTALTSSETLFSGGAGTSDSPYLISSVNDLKNMALWHYSISYNSRNFLLTCDIDLNGSEENQWGPIGNDEDELEDCTFDGGGHTISGLYINNEYRYQGLFGYVDESTIANLTVEGEVTSTNKNCGGIAGKTRDSQIFNSHNRANVTGTSRVGGISGGGSYSFFANCSNTGTILGDDDDGRVGGITGTSSYGTIIASYNTGAVSNSGGSAYAIAAPGGGDYPSVSDCYYSNDCGGEVLEDDASTSYDISYIKSADFVEEINAAVKISDLEFVTSVTINEWEMGADGFPTTSMNAIEFPDLGESYFSGGEGTADSPCLISSIEDLEKMAELAYNLKNRYFLLTCDLNLNGSEGNQWSPIEYFENNYFDGDEHTISGLYINSEESFRGLFGYVSGSTIANLTVEGEVTSTNQNSGGVTGMAVYSYIINCHNKANITGTSRVGGVAGGAGYSYLFNCSNSGEIAGDDNGSSGFSDLAQMRVGGIAGTSGGTLVYGCYNVGKVSNISGNAYPVMAPGGDDNCPTYAYNCYYDEDCGGVDTHSTATALTSSYMLTSSFVDDLNLSTSAINNNLTDDYKANAWVSTSSYPTTSAAAGTEGGDGTLPDDMGEITPVAPVVTLFSGGNGTSDDPYLISTAADMYTLSEWTDNLYGLYFDVTADIDLGGSENSLWSGIGCYAENDAFESCVFNGFDHTISGLYANKPGYIALFSSVLNSTICNLTVEGLVKVEYDRAAGFASIAENSYFVNCHNNAQIEGPCWIGGIVAEATNCYLLNCSNIATILCNDSSTENGVACAEAGGLVGWLNGGAIYGCYNAGLLINQATPDNSVNALFYHDSADTNPIYCFNNYYSDDCLAIDTYSVATAVDATTINGGNFIYNLNQSLSIINAEEEIFDTPKFAYKWIAGTSYPTTSMDYGTVSSGTLTLPDDKGLVDFDGSTDGDGSSTDGDGGSTDGDGGSTEGDGSSTEGDGSSTEGDGTSTEGDGLYSGGLGTSASPYLISNGDDLWYLSDNYEDMTDKYFVVTCDINLDGSESNQWQPIGYNKNSYIENITFDGAGYTISGIYINNQNGSASGYQGLFGHLCDSTVSNLTVEGTITSNNQNSGGITGMAASFTIITNCHNRVNITGTSRVGGIAGGCGDSYIYNCSNSGTLIGDDYNTDQEYAERTLMRIGGIAGTSGNSYIYNCYNVGDVQNTNSATDAVAYAIASPGGDDDEPEKGITNCYYRDDCGGVDDYSGTSTACTSDYMMSAEFVSLLNGNISGSMLEWEQTETYPTTVTE